MNFLQELKDINLILEKVFLLLPQYCLGKGLIDMSTNQLEKEAYALLGKLYDVFLIIPHKLEKEAHALPHNCIVC